MDVKKGVFGLVLLLLLGSGVAVAKKPSWLEK